MKFQRAKDVLTGALIAALVVGTVPTAFAKVSNVSIPVSYNNIKIVVDGKQLQTDKEPFIYEGTTYLPVRAVGEAVGKTVSWDGSTNTVTLGTTAQAEETPVATAYSRKNPAPVGTEQTVAVERLSDEYTAKVKVESVERGSGAWEKIKAANQFNSKPEEGKEYILAKVSISVSNVTGDKAVSVSEYMFDCFSAEDKEYADMTFVVTPSPDFGGDIYDGGELTGYIAFCVDKNDAAPKIVFERNYDGTGGAWFSIKK